ncbi:MAG: AAA family ATPase [Betaproteobacteria bacterium]|nr:AAA family ATPase [Betaproteobacteria bacterium]
MRPNELMRVIEREIASPPGAHAPIMIWGPPGVGKSCMVAAAAGQAGLGLIDLRLAQMEPTDLRGIPFRDGKNVVWAVPGLLPDRERHGERGILFLDEITSAVPTVTAAAYQLILDRRLGEYRVPPGWLIFAAGNRHGDRGVTYAMSAPLANRFVHYEIEPDVDDWVIWAFDAGIDPRLIAFVRFRPDLLFQFDPERQSAAFPSPRSWEYADRALKKFHDVPSLLRESIKGSVGSNAAAALAAYLHHLDVLPDPARALAGDPVQVPATVELEYAFATSLARHVARLASSDRRGVLGRALTLARQFKHREIGVMLVTDLHRIHGRPFYDIPEFGEWAAEVQDLVSFARD